MKTSTSFVPGNLAAVKHGARSPRLQLVKQQSTGRRIRREVKAGSREWLTRLVVAVESRLASYYEYLDRVGGPLTYRGMPRRCMEMLMRDERFLAGLYDRLENRAPSQSDDLAALLRGSRE